METKYNHNDLTKQEENIHPIASLYFEFLQLKNLFRQGWLERGISKDKCESVAEHSFMVALLSVVIIDHYRLKLDTLKVIKMALFHETGEIRVGDLTPHDNIDKQTKDKLELNAAVEVFSVLPNPKQYIELFEEYLKQETKEAKFVKQVDLLEMGMQGINYEKMGYEGLEQFTKYVKERLDSEEMKEIFYSILKKS